MKVDVLEAFKNARIIVLYDDRAAGESLAGMIQSWGLRAEGFVDPVAALENIRQEKCDLILLDFFVSGICALDLIPKFEGDLRIIVVAGFADMGTAARTLEIGAFDLLEKPFQDELLYHSIMRALAALESERVTKNLIEDLDQSRLELVSHQKRLENLNSQLLDTNKALSIFAQNVENEREEIEKRIALKLRNLIIPLVGRLKNEPALCRYQSQLDMLTKQIEDLTSGFAIDSRVAMTLSFTELQIASLIKNGVSTEEIAKQLHIAESTVRTHRKNIRRKLKINNAQFSLRNFLNSRN